MNNSQQTEDTAIRLARWSARVSGLLTTGFFLFIIILVVINEDKPPAQAVPTLVLLVVAIMAAFMAWRWERIGGMVLVMSSLGLGISVHMSSAAFGLGPVGLLMGLLIYSLPPLITGILYLLSGQRSQAAIPTGAGTTSSFPPKHVERRQR
jgi:hypothetical protein